MRKYLLLPAVLALTAGCATAVPGDKLAECRKGAAMDKAARDRLCEIRPVYSQDWDGCFARSSKLYRTAIDRCED